MSFKILLKQSFRSLSKKFRLYLSLIIFLIVAFSMIAGIGTYFTTWRTDMDNIINTGKIQNFEINKFKFSSESDNDDSGNTLFKFSEKGQESFKKYLGGLLGEDDESKIKNLIPDDFINELGSVYGNVSLISGNDDLVSKLNPVSKYFGHNLMFMYLDHVFKGEDSNFKLDRKTIVGNIDTIDGIYAGDRSVTFDIRPMPENPIADGEASSSPYEDNDLNKLYTYKSKKISKKLLDQYNKEKLVPFYTNPKFLRDTKHKVGDRISAIVNNSETQGYIAGLRASKYNIFFYNKHEALFVPMKTFGDMTNSNYVDAQSMIGYYQIPNSQNAYYNEKEYDIAFKKINELLLSDGNDPNAIFVKTKGNKSSETINLELDDTNAKVTFYHEPMNIYQGFMVIMIVVICILVIIVSYFIIDESIRSEKKTLWFLKSMGETTFKISLLNSMSVIVPLFVALAAAIPGTMLIMEFLTIAITTDYSFTIKWYALTPIFAIMIVSFFVGILLIFLLINSSLISGKALSIQSGDKLSHFQMFLSKVTNPFIKNANGKFRVGFAFIKQNLIKNLVSFVIFAILFTVTLFGVQFNRSIHNQENAYQKWMNPYNSISTLYPKKMITNDGDFTTYQTLESSEYKKEQNDDKGLSEDSSSQKTYSHLVNTYNHDAFKYVAENWFNAIDKEKFPDWESYKDKTIIFDSKTKEIISMPQTLSTNYYETLGARLGLLFAQADLSFDGDDWKPIPDYPTYEHAKVEWEKLINGTDDIPNPDYPLDPHKTIKIDPSYNKDDMRELMDHKAMHITATGHQETNVSLAQWTLRQFQDISLWDINSNYLKTAMIVESQLPANVREQIKELASKQKNRLPKEIEPAFESMVSVLKAQKEIFGEKYPSFGINFGNIIGPEDKHVSATALSAAFKGIRFFGYGFDINNQPFTDEIDPSSMPATLHDEESEDDGLTYTVIDTIFSEETKNQRRWKLNDIIPVDLSQTNIKYKAGKHPLALKITGFKSNDSVLTEGFFNIEALKTYFKDDVNDLKLDISKTSLNNTFYTTGQMPYFLQHITVPHMVRDGTSIDDYIYQLDTFTSDHKTTQQISKIFADTVDAYAKLMTKIIILLIVLCFALSSIIITLIMFENKKTILLFKAMGYRKQDIIWYIISGYLIAALLALVFGFGISAAATFGLSSMFAAKIFLQLIFTPYWLWFVIGIFETACFMALVVVSIVTYTRVLKPRDAFATL